MSQAKRDDNFVTSTLLVGSDGETFPWEGDETTGRAYVDLPGGSGTVTSVSVVTANGLAGTVATSTTTPAITLSTTITGVLKGNGTAISVAVNSDLPAMSATVGGAVPTPPNNTTTFLRGDGTFATPSATVPTTITVANEATDTSCFLGFFTAATGDLGPKTNANLAFNSNTGVLTLTAPVLGTPTSGTLTNCTGFPTAQLSGLGTGVATALAVNVGSAGAFVTFNGALGTPSSGTVTNLTGTASININGTVGATTPTTATFSTATINTQITLAENASVALDPAGSADGKYTGITVTATAGYTQAFGDLVYLAVADSRWELADADSTTTAGPVALAMVVVAGTDGAACTLLLQGIIRADAKFPTMTVGATQYVGETAGEIQGAIPAGADNIIRTVGYALTANELYFNPSTDWQITVA